MTKDLYMLNYRILTVIMELWHDLFDNKCVIFFNWLNLSLHKNDKGGVVNIEKLKNWYSCCLFYYIFTLLVFDKTRGLSYNS